MNNFLYSLFGFQRSHNKLRLLLVVLIHILGWCLFFLIPFLFYPVRFVDNHFWLRESIGKLFPVGLFYLNYYFLLPRFFEKRKYLLYFSLVFVAILIVVAQDIALRNGSFNRRSHFKGIAFGLPFEKPSRNKFFVYNSDFCSKYYSQFRFICKQLASFTLQGANYFQHTSRDSFHVVQPCCIPLCFDGPSERDYTAWIFFHEKSK